MYHRPHVMRFSKALLLVGIIFSLADISSCLASGCDGITWFGSACQYKCRCDGLCDISDGECIGGAECLKGWFGPACQYVDLAYSPTRTPQWLYDANDNTCNNDTIAQSVTVDLNGLLPFTWLRMHVRNSAARQEIKVTFQNSISGNTVDCNNMMRAAVDSETLDIHCDLSITINQVLLSGKGVKDLCSVYISGGRNVALRQNTKQTTTIMDYASSEKAVDGDTRGVTGESGTCSETDIKTDKDPTWSIMFSQPQAVNRYVLYNKITCCLYRLREFVLTSFNENGQEIFQYQDQDEKGRANYTLTSATSVISSVEIKATFPDAFDNVLLTLCEVEIYGDADCRVGRYGRECEKTCNCAADNEGCFVSTGGCPSGCAAGFYGERCHLPCMPKFHGVDCEKTCSTNCVDQLCNRGTGFCDKCPLGKSGNYCETDCPFGTYGLMCKQTCSQSCGGDGHCHPENGQCSSGCRDGYNGLLCNKRCDPGKYGKDCSESCSEFCNFNDIKENESQCDYISGVCLRGCQTGYKEPLCVTVAEDDSSSSSDLAIGPSIGIGVLIIVLIVGAILAVFRYRRRTGAGVLLHKKDDQDNDCDLPRNETMCKAITGSSSESRHRDTAQYENADVGHCENIDEIAPKEEAMHDADQQHFKMAKQGVENRGYARF